MSLIDTPPSRRLPVATLVQPFSSSAIAQALHKELQRGGQAFYVVARVRWVGVWCVNQAVRALCVCGQRSRSSRSLCHVHTRTIARPSDHTRAINQVARPP